MCMTTKHFNWSQLWCTGYGKCQLWIVGVMQVFRYWLWSHISVLCMSSLINLMKSPYTTYIFLFMQKRESYKGWNKLFWILQVVHMCRDCQNIKFFYYKERCRKLKCTSQEYEYRILCIPGWMQWRLMLRLTVRPDTYLNSMSVQSLSALSMMMHCFKKFVLCDS